MTGRCRYKPCDLPGTVERLMSSVDTEEVEKCLREYGRLLVADLGASR